MEVVDTGLRRHDRVGIGGDVDHSDAWYKAVLQLKRPELALSGFRRRRGQVAAAYGITIVALLLPATRKRSPSNLEQPTSA
jgi:hypothetical protein